MYSENEYLQLSGIQHFMFCRRQWALIHIEGQWEENLRTAEGRIMHEHAHDENFNERRKDIIITRAVPISSPRLGLSGECDIVEFHKNEFGVELFGHKEKYIPVPIEYKRGKPKENECDILQLTAQAMCLEDMLCCEIAYGCIFYGETRRRWKVEFNTDLRKKTKQVILEMHRIYQTRRTPKAKRTKECNACSLKNICLPALGSNKNAGDYIRNMIEGLS